jgi:hypothetical protein
MCSCHFSIIIALFSSASSCALDNSLSLRPWDSRSLENSMDGRSTCAAFLRPHTPRPCAPQAAISRFSCPPTWPYRIVISSCGGGVGTSRSAGGLFLPSPGALGTVTGLLGRAAEDSLHEVQPEGCEAANLPRERHVAARLTVPVSRLFTARMEPRPPGVSELRTPCFVRNCCGNIAWVACEGSGRPIAQRQRGRH